MMMTSVKFWLLTPTRNQSGAEASNPGDELGGEGESEEEEEEKEEQQ